MAAPTSPQDLQQVLPMMTEQEQVKRAILRKYRATVVSMEPIGNNMWRCKLTGMPSSMRPNPQSTSPVYANAKYNGPNNISLGPLEF